MPLEKRLSEQKLFEELKLSNEKALVQLYKDNYTMVRNYIMSNNGKTEDVEDVLQEAVVVVWEKVRDKDFELSSRLSTFLMAIAKNLWLKKLNKTSRIDFDNDKITAMRLGYYQDFSNEKRKIVGEMMNKLDSTCKQILILFYFKDMETKRIAEIMNFANTDVVKSKKYQCFKKLQSLFERNYNNADFFE
ncbi:MAG: sigma-70 family RNA polymerase sigma factor [Bacteroidetes bacterium]|nr:sigma-70 family RNA polymerase sigma factor [Bacteroidota bacterium]